jgi:hypothetical protein
MATTAHIVLLGDSIFDNAAYVGGGPDVVAQLRQCLPSGARATLLAVDGAVVSDVERQLARLPADATMLVLSAGGNDALGEAHLLQQPTRTVADAVALLGEAQWKFAERYSALLDQIDETGIPSAGCTIYDGNFPPPQGPVITSALSLFNDAITRALFSRAKPLIDLSSCAMSRRTMPIRSNLPCAAARKLHGPSRGLPPPEVSTDRLCGASPSAHTEEPAARTAAGST